MAESHEKMNAGRLFMCIVLAVLFGLVAEKMNAQEQPLEIFPVTKVVENKDLGKFLAVSGAEVQTPINAKIYKEVIKNPGAYMICYAEGLTPEDDILSVCPKDYFKRCVVEVDSIGFDGRGVPVVFFTDGRAFSNDDPQLLELNKGQKLEVTWVMSLPQDDRNIMVEIIIYRSVSRDTPCSEKNGHEVLQEQEALKATATIQSKVDEDSGC